jgi:enoyl-CoA hydratase/carnithine racemase
MSVELQRRGQVATLTINRPDKLNALDYDAIALLHQCLTVCEDDSGVRAVILTGAGERAFSAGADIGDLARSIQGGVERALREVIGRGQGLTRRIENYPKPVIAAVNGLALGGGCEITEAAHLALAAEHASFGKPEISLGFPPPFGGSQRLPRHVGRKRGLEMILTGDPVDALRACELGLVNAVVPAGELLDRAYELAERVNRHAPTAVAACLAAVTRGLNVAIDEGLAVEAGWFASTVGSRGVDEGLSRFLGRRAGGHR